MKLYLILLHDLLLDLFDYDKIIIDYDKIDPSPDLDGAVLKCSSYSCYARS